MAKIKLTKNELKTQRDALKRFERYLPTLQLKKQQLQTEVRRIREELEDTRRRLEAEATANENNISLYSSEDVRKWTSLVRVKAWHVGTRNIAGINVPVHQGLEFDDADYDMFEAPVWLDSLLAVLRAHLEVTLQMQIAMEQSELLENELRVVTQRVNLFEKVKIPEATENIRRINIYLGDQQTNSVGRGKIAKSKCATRDADLVGNEL